MHQNNKVRIVSKEYVKQWTDAFYVEFLDLTQGASGSFNRFQKIPNSVCNRFGFECTTEKIGIRSSSASDTLDEEQQEKYFKEVYNAFFAAMKGFGVPVYAAYLKERLGEVSAAMIMEQGTDASLSSSRIRDNPTFFAERTYDFLRNASNNGFLLTDIKLENVIITEDNRVLGIDFDSDYTLKVSHLASTDFILKVNTVLLISSMCHDESMVGFCDALREAFKKGYDSLLLTSPTFLADALAIPTDEVPNLSTENNKDAFHAANKVLSQAQRYTFGCTALPGTRDRQWNDYVSFALGQHYERPSDALSA